MTRLILFNKPYGVICQFTPEAGYRTLKEFIALPGFYPAGRLDTDSEGLVLLTDDGKLQQHISDPRHKWPKVYWMQVEGVPGDAALEYLRRGVRLKEFVTDPAEARLIEEPLALWPRNPPIRFRKNIPAVWIEIVLHEGKNRQVRRMTAATGFPTLRLIRYAIGPYTFDGLAPGEWRIEDFASMQCSAKIDQRPRAQSKQWPFQD